MPTGVLPSALSWQSNPLLRVRFPYLGGVCGRLEQVTGIEPALKAWEALILPLNYTCGVGVF